ncbi:MAG: phosphoribosylamine--glycine ligase [Paracoccaceae bacterium]|nr:phosphoribosylamine--glycine ligase [Paracoccaceae bacterium]
MNILIIGSGGREHSLAWAVAQNPKCENLIVAPGNAGIAEIAVCADIDIYNNSQVLEFSQNNKIDLVIIGPEGPLANGISDLLRKGGIKVFGCSKEAARLESSKKFTKDLCKKVGVPTANFEFFNNPKKAKEYVIKQGVPIVIKLDGLAAGKGVVVARDQKTAFNAIDDFLNQKESILENKILIEEFLEGEEASFFVLSDGKNLLPIGSAQDHKTAYDNDQGPNTGGMGAYSPAPILTQSIMDLTIESIIKPTIEEMSNRGTPYKGVLFAGLMIKNGIPKLIEYNVRLGDPECQALMIRLGPQVLDLIIACVSTKLDQAKVNWADDHSVTIVLATKGYPGNYRNGSKIRFVEELKSDSLNQIFHAGTKRDNSSLIANGGRVLNITARGGSLLEARDRAYKTVEKIDWPEGFYRSDIGWRAL